MVVVRALTCAACHSEPGTVHCRQATHSMQSSGNSKLLAEHSQQHIYTSRTLHNASLSSAARQLGNACFAYTTRQKEGLALYCPVFQDRTTKENRLIILFTSSKSLSERSWQHKHNRQHTWNGQQVKVFTLATAGRGCRPSLPNTATEPCLHLHLHAAACNMLLLALGEVALTVDSCK